MISKILFLFYFITSLTAHYDIDDTLLYKIDFQPFGQVKTSLDSVKGEGREGGTSGDTVSNPESTIQDDIDQDNSQTDTVVVTSIDKEKFQCKIPKVVQKDKSDSSDYSGPDALGLLESLFVESSCAYRAEPYWTYELCHGKHLRQYHEERDGKTIKLQEYFLGLFTKDQFEELRAEHEKDVANGITRHPPTKMIEKIAMPYYELTMTGGTKCDLTGLPRRTRVMYTCYPSGRNEIYSFKEVSTCEYEVVVLTATLCKHPSYRPAESKENLISCSPLTGDQAWRPKRLQQLEVDSLKLRTESVLEAHWSPGDKPGQVKIEIRPVRPRDPDQETPGPDTVKETIKKVKEAQWKPANRQPFKPLMDPGVVKQFLKGDYCLYGGTGWWKYEFCYGKKVDQYHEEAGGKGPRSKTVINLGHFHLADHLAWLEAHPSKRPKEAEARRQVSVFYSGGDVCDLTGKPRQIEVKLKCKAADSPSTVSLYLLEPKVCEYVLGVESPLVCDLLPHADPKTGLFPEEILDSVGEAEEPPAETLQSLTEEELERLTVTKLKNIVHPQKLSSVTSKLTKKTSYRSSENTKVVEESVEDIDGVKTTVKRTTVDGVLVDEVKISEKDGVVVEHRINNKEVDDESGIYETTDEAKDDSGKLSEEKDEL